MKRTTVPLIVAALCYTAAAQTSVTGVLIPAWSRESRWTGVAGDESHNTIYTIGYSRGAEVDLDGHIRREFPLPRGEGTTLRLARFPDPALVTFTHWLHRVNVYDLRGTPLWNYPVLTGVDSVWPGDLDGDGSDELVIGYNGNSGVHVVDGKGQLRWKPSTTLGNVWQVTVGDVLGQGRPQVLATSGPDHLEVFDSDGRGRVDVRTPGVFVNMVRVQKLRAADTVATIVAAGKDLGSKVNTVMALAGDGQIRWRLELPSEVMAADTASARPWLALGLRDGQVFVIDVARGRTLGSANEQGRPEVAWAGDPPLLLVATGTSLNAFRVVAD